MILCNDDDVIFIHPPPWMKISGDDGNPTPRQAGR
jgi:hypothetical protein